MDSDFSITPADIAAAFEEPSGIKDAVTSLEALAFKAALESSPVMVKLLLMGQVDMLSGVVIGLWIAMQAYRSRGSAKDIEELDRMFALEDIRDRTF